MNEQIPIHTDTPYLYTFHAIEEMLSSVAPLSSSLTSPLLQKPQRIFPIHIRPLFSKSQICFAIPPSNQNPLGEEARWLREEQRWLREEQRWLREESRWSAEREALLLEISSLKLKIQELERFNSVQGASVSDTVANIAKLIQVLKEGDLGKNVNRIAESGSGPVPLDIEAAKEEEEEEEEEVVVKEVISLPDRKETPQKRTVQKRTTLRKGSEGDEVQALQEALQKLGFYSGEEDVEFSSFSSGTESAVKTWQATLDIPEDGIVTAELLELLFASTGSGIPPIHEHKSSDSLKSENGSPVASVTNVPKVQEKIIDEGVKKDWSSENRVFLLGENRWEDSSRLSANKRPVTVSGKGNVITKCITCRGEGRLLCMECDGTGEPNIEEQFMEWVDEGAKCPYCEGLGFIPCELCGGKK